MLILDILIALVALWSVPSVSCIGRACTNPAVRREWRAFSVQEKAAWIQAVNVRTRCAAPVHSDIEAVFWGAVLITLTS
jgi:hypothetical protein